MARVIIAFLIVLALAASAAWLADQPGHIIIEMAGYEIAASLFVAGLTLLLFAGIIIFLWLTYRWIVDAPLIIGSYFRNRKRRRGFEALSRGLVAAAAGDGITAARESSAANKQLANTPLSLLLKVQIAQLRGKDAEAKETFQAMLENEQTEGLGLRGLFMLARDENDSETAHQYAQRALKRPAQNPWASEALFELQSSQRNWLGALKTLEARRRHRQIDRSVANRLAAVLRTARALETLDTDPATALDDALEAHHLEPEFVPAAATAAHLLAEKGEAGRAARILEKTWRINPHPELATLYCHVHPGDSARERLNRAKTLAARNANHKEGAISIAKAALEAREFNGARAALDKLPEHQISQRVCLLMAEIENAENGDLGRVRGWLTRAVNAPRDPVWIADGHVSNSWLPISPVTGKLDAFKWRVMVEGALPDIETTSLIADPIREVDNTKIDSQLIPEGDEQKEDSHESARPDEITSPPNVASETLIPHPPDDPGVSGGDSDFDENPITTTKSTI
jgi:HemY protein